jgi:hypothetical protein
MVWARCIAAFLFALAMLVAFGWWVEPNAAHAVGLIAAGLLSFTLSTIPVGRVP